MDFSAIKSNLESLGYKVTCFETKEQASDYINSCVDGKTIGFGGSVTLAEMGLFDSLSKHNKTVWHWTDAETRDKVLHEAMNAEIYFSSVNGIAETGEIVNIDGHCNRIASTLYGHEKVYFVVGRNKIAPDYEKALFRARNVAAPKNAQRLKKNTPCAVNADKCYNCKSKERICRALTVFWEKPTSSEYEIILINEDLGF
ncbi:MAG: lactate utilization protein [Clostridiales bacterium]|nr:lactate utilization protein [Candidatus Coliplasma equi]